MENSNHYSELGTASLQGVAFGDSQLKASSTLNGLFPWNGINRCHSCGYCPSCGRSDIKPGYPYKDPNVLYCGNNPISYNCSAGSAVGPTQASDIPAPSLLGKAVQYLENDKFGCKFG